MPGVGRPADAAQVFESIVEIDPYLTDSWRGLLNSLFLAGQIPQLDAAIQKAKRHFPNHLSVRTFDGLIRVMKGSTDEAEEVLTKVLAENPNQPFVNHSLALMKRAQGNSSKAEQLLREEIRLHPPAVPARRTLVEILAEQRRYEDQLTQLEAIAAVEKPSTLTMHSKAQALFNLGRFDEAAIETNRCVKFDSKYPGCWMLLANVLSKQGRQEEGKKMYAKAVELKTSQGR